VRHVAAAGGDDAPDHPLLVVVEPDDVAGAGQGQVAAVKMAGHQAVETIIVNPGKPIGPVGMRPDPVGERVLDTGKFLLGRLRCFDVEDALLGAVLDHGVEDLRRRAVQRVVQQETGVAAPGGDAAESDPEREFVDFPWVPTFQIFGDLGMLRVLGIRLSLEHVVETRDAAAVLGRAAPFPTDVAWVGDVRFTWADGCGRQAVRPAVAEIVEVVDRCLARLQHVAQTDLDRLDARRRAPVLFHRQTIGLLADGKLPEVVIEPSHGDRKRQP
jgi:hypothetical protein